jgi:phosphoglucosamine mutase
VARRLFGTDGVRGVAGELLTADLAVKLGRAATLQSGASKPRVLLIRDTRESGEMLEAALAAGVAAAGGDVYLGGVLPTPAAPLLLGRYGFDLAAVISASHNPYRDNGIKFFGADGFKLSDATEEAIEDILDEAHAAAGGGSGAGGASIGIGRIRALHGTEEDYLRELHTRFADVDLTGLDVLLDCANGATYAAAPEIFRRLGADVTVIADTPDGRNINEGCGSTHVDALAAQVVSGGHAVGFAFDGDGDRVLAVDRNGVIVDGDELIALAALHLRARGRVGRAVGAVQQHVGAGQVEVGEARVQLAQVVLLGPVQRADAPGPRRRLVLLQARLDRLLGRVGQLEAIGAEELDPVVAVGVVAGADDGGQVEAVAADQQRRGRRRQHTAEEDVAPGRRNACGKRGLEHLAALARVANQEHPRVQLR